MIAGTTLQQLGDMLDALRLRLYLWRSEARWVAQLIGRRDESYVGTGLDVHEAIEHAVETYCREQGAAA